MDGDLSNLESLLKEISKIVVEEKTRQEEGRKRGEKFNIFNVLGLSRNEVRLHSAFLAELLNPDGNHGLGDKFLKAFIKDVINDESFQFDSASAKPQVEFTIGSINEDYTKGGRIDILIQDKKQKSIIIENKIDAVDQPKQLLRYYNYIKNNPQYRILYLTKEGTEPKEFSLGGNKDIEYQCISYKEDIINWLEKCIEFAALHPAIREIIQQYRLNLQQIFNIMSDSNKKEMIDILLNGSNIEATLEILSLNAEIKEKIIRDFVESCLKDLAKEFNMQFECPDDDFYELKSKKYNRQIWFSLKDNTKVRFTIEQGGTSVCFGISTKENPNQILRPSIIRDWVSPNPAFPYGHKNFKGGLQYWDSNEALFDMIKGKDGEIYKTLKEELKNVLDNHYLQDLNNSL